jgi:preprotein translocase subunit SecG
LTKLTSILATFFIIISVVLVSISHKEIKEVQSVIDTEQEKNQNQNLPQIPENQK